MPRLNAWKNSDILIGKKKKCLWKCIKKNRKSFNDTGIYYIFILSLFYPYTIYMKCLDMITPDQMKGLLNILHKNKMNTFDISNELKSSYLYAMYAAKHLDSMKENSLIIVISPLWELAHVNRKV